MNQFNTQQLRNCTRRKVYLCLILSLVLNGINLFSQASTNSSIREYVPKSPEASAFNKYGDIGVSQFTGSPNISFPLSLSEEVPISISYNASGNKPEEHHGWVGAGFNLNVGGMISRIKKGDIDEHKELDYPDYQAYYYNYARLQDGNSTWTGQNRLDEVMTTPYITDLGFKKGELEPDEFVFNFGSYSGSFLLNHEGKWVFRGNNPSEFIVTNVDIRENQLVNLTNTLQTNYPRQIMGFTIIANDGTEYIFGGNESSVDYSYSLVSNQSVANYGYQSAFPVGWHLTKIKYISGKQIDFVYVKDQYQVILNKQKTIGSVSLSYSQPWYSASGTGQPQNVPNSLALMRNAHLTEINTPYESIKFERSVLNPSEVADYPIETTLFFKDNLNITQIHQQYSVDLTQRKWFKLNAIKTYKKGTTTILNHIKLEYKNSPSNRLQLESIKQVDVDNYNYTITPPPALNSNNSILIAGFQYDGNPLPPYGSNLMDHWGYYSNVSQAPIDPANPTTVEQTYYNNRQPHEINMTAEILKKITYPTGGYTELEFEPHQYSTFFTKSVPTIYNNSVVATPSTTTNTPAGGLRIKKITNYLSDGVIGTQKNYKYVKNYSSTQQVEVSSGILGTKPFYFALFSGNIGGLQIDYAHLNEQSVNPINLTNGSPVTYSEVTEIDRDNSYTMYKFSSADDAAFRDRTGVNVKIFQGTTFVNPNRDPYIDFEHLRGRLLEQKLYTNTDVLVQKTVNEYTNTLDNSKAVRAIYVQDLTASLSAAPVTTVRTEIRAVAYLIHTSSVFLNKSTTTSYYFNPTAQIAVVTENLYDSRKNLTQQTVKHLNNTEIKSDITTEYSYAYDKNVTTSLVVNPNVSESTDAQGHRQAMITKFMIGIPLETKNNFNKGSKIEYKNLSNGMPTPSLLPYKFYNQNRLTPTQFDEQFRIEIYTDYDKPSITYQKGFTTPVAYSWSNGLLFQKTFGDLKWVFTYDLNKRLLTEKTDENGLKMQFSYDGYRRLKKIDDRYQTGNMASTEQATMEYDYKYQNIAGDIPYSYVETKTWYRGVTNTTPNTDKMVSKQYIDGLGRPLSMVKEYYTPAQQHLKSYVLYDNLGRQDKAYQPIDNLNPGVDANLSSVLSGKPYVQTLYEASPLSRPLTQIMEDDRKIESRYGANSANEVKTFTVTLGRVSNDQLLTVALNGNYAANTLYKTIVWDENGTNSQTDLTNRFVGRTEIFKDKLGRLILTRKFVKNAGDSFVNVDTYNIYDDYGNLVMVIPPDAVSTTVNYSLVFQYNYDNLNRLVEKKIPGAKYVRFYYNERDLMVLMQDGNMRNASYGNTSNTGAGSGFAKKYLATLYDAIGRPIKTGFTNSSFPTLTLGQDFEVTDAHIFTRLSSTEFYKRDENGTINPNGAFSTNWVKHQEGKVLKNTAVSTVRENVWSYIERRAGLEYTGNPIWTGKQHLLCITKRYGWMDVGDAPVDDNDYDGTDWRVSGYNGAQMPTVNIHYTFSTNYAQQIRTAETPTYDHALRMTHLDHAFSMGGAGLPPQTNLSNMIYNYKDQLTQKNLAYQTNHSKYLQNIDYTYNVRGWLTNINQLNINCSSPSMPIMTPQSPSSGPIQNLAITPFINNMANDIANKAKRGEAAAIAALADNTDLFSQTINYHTPDARFGNPDAQYNGNISNTYWQVAGRAIQGYGFKYDDLNRLTEGNYYDVACSGSQPQFTGGKFTEKILEYDLRGNIKKLQRFGFKEPVMNTNNDVVGNYGEIDNLTYTYDPSNLNRIQTITDDITAAHLTKGFKYNNATSSAYTYDDNGNMISDPNKGLTISYNYLNLPETITMPSGDGHVGVIQFVYDASGQKHRRIVKKLVSGVNGVTTTDLKITDYVGGYEYEVTNPISDNGVLLNPANSLPSRIHHTEGAITKEANSNVYQYEFALRDHLGNTRVTFKDKNNDATIEYSHVDPSVNEVSQINHYYPFGLNMEGNWNGQNGSNKYQYNGKEWNDDFGLGLSDYGARFYDPAVGRWWSVDLLAEKYANSSPYLYVLNRPTIAIDPDGERILFVNGYYLDNWIGRNIIGSDKPNTAYWGNGFDAAAQNFFSDYSNITSTNYINGSSTFGGDMSGQDRYAAGYEYAKTNFKTLTEGLAKDETFKMVTHSEGGAYGAGVAKFLIEKGYTVETVVHLSADEGDEFSTPIEPMTYQLSYHGDWVTGNKLINGVDKSGVVNSGLGKLYVHGSTRNARVFSEVKDLITVGTEINLGVVNGQTISWRSQIQGTTPNGTDFTQINGQVISNQNGTKKTD